MERVQIMRGGLAADPESVAHTVVSRTTVRCRAE